MKLMKRDEVIAVLASAAHGGSLGLFVGTGFSMATTRGSAPSWKELLQLIAIDFEYADPTTDTANIGLSMAEIASGLVRRKEKDLAADDNFKELTPSARSALAQQLIKNAAAKHIAALQPHPEELSRFQALLHEITPAWVITTNYDDLFQKIHGKTKTFLPYNVIVPTVGLVPVWHIHGTVIAPNSMVLTQEDYVEHLRPGTYRQTKLAHMMAESTTLMLGYGYGDVNVQTASMIAHSTDLLEIRPSRRLGDNLIVHVAREQVASEDVKSGPADSISITVNEITTLFTEILNEVNPLRERSKKVRRLVVNMKNNPGGLTEYLIRNMGSFKNFTELIRDFPSAYHDFDVVAELGQLFSEVSKRAYETGGFPWYGIWLECVLTMLLEWDLADMPPPIFDLLASQLAEVVCYVDPDGKRTLGRSWRATDAWRKNKSKLAEYSDLLDALDIYSQRSPAGEFCLACWLP